LRLPVLWPIARRIQDYLRSWLGTAGAGSWHEVAVSQDLPTEAAARQIARHDPARVLREVPAKRAILEFYIEPPDGLPPDYADAVRDANTVGARASRPLTVIEAIALDRAAIWKDHPDYDQSKDLQQAPS
jgi:Family of unknown function (DUF6221)